MNNAQKQASSQPAGVGNYVRKGYQGARNTGARAYGSYQGMSLLGKILTIMLIIALILAVAMWIRYLYNITSSKSAGSPFLITNPIKIYEREITKTVPNSTNGLAFTYNFWVYIQDWELNFGAIKPIFVKGDGDSVCPGIYLYPRTNSLKCSISTYNDRTSATESCDISNGIPLNKWTMISYVLNNRTVDIYIDSKIERSCVLRGLPRLNNSSVLIGGSQSYNGKLSMMQYFDRALQPFEIAEAYSNGPIPASKFNILKRLGL